MFGGGYLTAGYTPMSKIMRGHSAEVLAEKASGTKQVALIVNNETTSELIETIKAWYYKVNCDVVVFVGKEALAKFPVPEIGCHVAGTDVHVLPPELAEDFATITVVAWPADSAEFEKCAVLFLMYTPDMADHVVRFGDHI